MAPHITVFPASTQAGQATIRSLLASDENPFVRGIYRDPSKAPADFTSNPRFEATKGDVGSGTGLDFTGSDAVFYIPPPTYDGVTDNADFANRCANNVLKALRDAQSVKKLVLHSAMGAQHDSGIGILKLNHVTDEILKDAAEEVIIVRPCYYFETFVSRNVLKGWVHDERRRTFESFVSPADYAVPLVCLGRNLLQVQPPL